MIKYLSFFLCSLLSWSCDTPTPPGSSKPVESRSDIQFAERFTVEEDLGIKIITIDKPWKGSKQAIKYLLYADTIPSKYKGDQSLINIKVPVESYVSNSTTHLALMELLGIEEQLVGFAQTQYIYSENIIDRLENEQLIEVGPDGSLNIETIINLNPDIVLAFNARSENRQLQKLSELGATIVMNAGYMETSVLGRFEWLKFIGHLSGKSDLANELFDQKIDLYDSLKKLVENKEKPTVVTGTLYGGTWFLPAGNNYGSNIVKAAGGDYLWAADEHDGWLNLDFESVYEKAWDADYWIGVSNFTKLADLEQADSRYAEFKSFKNGNVYTYMARVNEKGANDYFESGNVNPEKLLADHIKILHPDLLPDYELYYYIKLE